MSALYPTTLCSALPRVVEAPYPTTLCNVLPRVVEAPTPTKHTSPRPMLLMIQRPAAGGASPSPTIYVSFASRLHVIATKRGCRTPTKRTSHRPALLMIQRPAAGGASPSPTISFVCFAFARHCNQTCGTSNTRVQAPYPTTLCNVLPRVVEAPTPTKRISSRPTLLMIQRPAAGGASPSPTISFICFAFARHCNQTCGTSNTRVQAPYPTTLCNALPPYTTFHFPFSTFNFPLTILLFLHSIRCSERKHGR